MRRLAADYASQIAGGGYFVHVRSRRSSNRDLRALRDITKGGQFYKVNFNIRAPGYWSANSDEMFAACRRLSNYLQHQYGIERDVRLPCGEVDAADDLVATVADAVDQPGGPRP